jgi:cytosine/adenosine deaminase-related metal-dependent hydrolase
MLLQLSFRGEAIPFPLMFQSSIDLMLKLVGQHSVIALMDAYGILDSSVLFSHANNASDEDAVLVKAKGAHVSSTPSTELQMGLGDPVCFDERLDWQSHASLGIDCHNNNATSMPSEMRVALAHSRGKYHESFASKDRFPLKINKTVQDAFNLGTINGARAIGMGDSLGSLTEGKLADIVIFDGLSPSMVCGAQQDPVAAIVLNSSPADIAMTIVDGVVRKANHKLCDIELSDGAEKFIQQDKAKLTWAEVAKELLRTRKGIVQKVDALDFTVAREGILALYQTDQSKIVAKV